jgi:hypothetical protein
MSKITNFVRSSIIIIVIFTLGCSGAQIIPESHTRLPQEVISSKSITNEDFETPIIPESQKQPPQDEEVFRKSIENEDFESAGRVCLSYDGSDNTIKEYCNSLFQEELKHNADLRIKWIIANGARYTDHELAVLLISAWLDSTESVAEHLPFDTIFRLKQTKIGGKVLQILKTNSLPRPISKNSEKVIEFYETRDKLIGQIRGTDKVLSAIEMNNYNNLLNRALQNNLELYQAVCLTKPKNQTKRSLNCWAIVVPAGIFVPEEESIAAINTYL